MFNGGDVIDQIDLTVTTAGGVLVPSEHLLQFAPRLFVQLGAFLNRGGATVVELVPLLEYDDTRPEFFRTGSIQQAADGWKKFLGQPVEITNFVKQMPLLVFAFAGRVDQSAAQIAVPTILILGQA